MCLQSWTWLRDQHTLLCLKSTDVSLNLNKKHPHWSTQSNIWPNIQALWSRELVQSLSCVWLFVTPWTAACQASLSFTISWSLLKLISIKKVMLSYHLILCYPHLLPLIFPSIRVFLMSRLFTSGGRSIKASASTSVLLMNIQHWFPFRLTGWISLQSKGLSSIFSNTTVQKHQFFDTQPSLWSNSHICTWLLKKM